MAATPAPPGDSSETWAQRVQLIWGWLQGLFNSDLPGQADAYAWLNGLFDSLP